MAAFCSTRGTLTPSVLLIVCTMRNLADHEWAGARGSSRSSRGRDAERAPPRASAARRPACRPAAVDAGPGPEVLVPAHSRRDGAGVPPGVGAEPEVLSTVSRRYPRPSGACAIPAGRYSVARPSIRCREPHLAGRLHHAADGARGRRHARRWRQDGRDATGFTENAGRGHGSSVLGLQVHGFSSAGIPSLAEMRLDHFRVPLDVRGRPSAIFRRSRHHDAVGHHHHEAQGMLRAARRADPGWHGGWHRALRPLRD